MNSLELAVLEIIRIIGIAIDPLTVAYLRSVAFIHFNERHVERRQP